MLFIHGSKLIPGSICVELLKRDRVGLKTKSREIKNRTKKGCLLLSQHVVPHEDTGDRHDDRGDPSERRARAAVDFGVEGDPRLLLVLISFGPANDVLVGLGASGVGVTQKGIIWEIETQTAQSVMKIFIQGKPKEDVLQGDPNGRDFWGANNRSNNVVCTKIRSEIV